MRMLSRVSPQCYRLLGYLQYTKSIPKVRDTLFVSNNRVVQKLLAWWCKISAKHHKELFIGKHVVFPSVISYLWFLQLHFLLSFLIAQCQTNPIWVNKCSSTTEKTACYVNISHMLIDIYLNFNCAWHAAFCCWRLFKYRKYNIVLSPI